MAAHTAPAGVSDTTYSISAALPTAYDATGYAVTSVVAFTAIGQVETFPSYGLTRSVNEFTPITGTITTVKGADGFGGGDMTCADIPADAGQVILKAAASSENHYSMKVTLPDGEIHFLDVMVSSWVLGQHQSGAFLKRTANIRVLRDPVIVAAS
ncbi:MAG: hypothetical protein Q7T25_14190 [Sideroxyarcus sp.]|nr:hypothetical protein [Sideroxyarcus sp.]